MCLVNIWGTWFILDSLHIATLEAQRVHWELCCPKEIAAGREWKNGHLWQWSPTVCPKEGTASAQTWLCNISSQPVCSYGEATSNWPNSESPQVALFYGVRMGLVERHWEVHCSLLLRRIQGWFTAYLCFSLLLLQVCFALFNKRWRALFFFSLCLSWNEPAGVIIISQVFSKTQIELRFLRFERNASASYRNFICKHLCQGRVEIAPTDLKCLVNKGSGEVNARVGNTQVTRCTAVVQLLISAFWTFSSVGFGPHTNSVQAVSRKYEQNSGLPDNLQSNSRAYHTSYNAVHKWSFPCH